MDSKAMNFNERDEQLEALEEQLEVEPIEKSTIFGGYADDNVPTSTYEYFNAQSNQIMNYTATTLYRIADNLFGWAMPEEARENMNYDLERMREDYIETERNIQAYEDYNEGISALSLKTSGMLYRGFLNPVNQAINVALTAASPIAVCGLIGTFLVNLAGDTTQYIADTKFYEGRNILADPKLQDLYNISANALLSLGTMYYQNKYSINADPDALPNNGPIYMRKKGPSAGERVEIKDSYTSQILTNVEDMLPERKYNSLSESNPLEQKYKVTSDVPPLERMANANKNNKNILNVMRDRGYDTLVDLQAMSEVATRKMYGQPQSNYSIDGVVSDIHNYAKSAIEMNQKYQNEIWANYGDKGFKRSSIDTEIELTHAVKPLQTGIENNLDQIYALYARELSNITGYNDPIGDILYDITKDLNKGLVVESLYGRSTFRSNSAEYQLYDFLQREFNEYAKSLDLRDDYSKALLYEKVFNKAEHQAYVNDLYTKGDIEGIKKLGAFIGEKVELTKDEAELVGLKFDETKANNTLKKNKGDYQDFKNKFTELVSNVKDKAKNENNSNKEKIAKGTEALKKEYKDKIDNAKAKRGAVATEKEVLREQGKAIRSERDVTIDTEHKNIISEKEKVTKSYRKQIQDIATERNAKTKEIKNKIAEIRKEETAEFNAIQKNEKLYDPDKLPVARKIHRKNFKRIEELKKEISSITKEYNKKIDELKKQQETEIGTLNKKEKDLKDSFSRGTKDFQEHNANYIDKYGRRVSKDVEAEIKKLETELESKIKAINKKYSGKEYNKYKRLEKDLKKVNNNNYKHFYKKYQYLEKEFEEIKVLGDLAKHDGKIVRTNTYSIKENPIEVTHAFYNAMANTNLASRKDINISSNIMGYTAYDYQKIYNMMEDWGNKSVEYMNSKKENPKIGYTGDTEIPKGNAKTTYNISPIDNFITAAQGFERETYDIFSSILSSNAERKAGLDEVRQLIENLSDGKGQYSKNYSLYEQLGMRGLTNENRNFARGQLEDIIKKNSQVHRYKPSFWIDPEKQNLDLGMVNKGVKDIAAIKFLANLNYLREFPQNQYRNVSGANKLGWNKQYSMIKDATDIIQVNYQLLKNYDNIKARTIDNIADPVVRRRTQLYVERRLANNIIWNDVNSKNPIYKIARGAQKSLRKLGDLAATGQLISDVHRISNAEISSIHYMLDILPEADSPLLRKIMSDNGITTNQFKFITERIRDLGEEGLMKLVWSGESPKSVTDYRIMSLFEQLSDVMGKEFDTYRKYNAGFLSKQSPLLQDMIFLYKRYSLGAVENFSTGMSTYIANDGMLRKRFDYNGDFKANYKQTFKGYNPNMIVPFTKAAISTTLMSGIVIKYAHGKLFGGPDDEKAETKFKSLQSVEGLVGFTENAIKGFALDITGIGIVYGTESPIGGIVDYTIGRAERAVQADNLNTTEKILYWLATVVAPEPIARGIDYIKLGRNIPQRINTFSKEEAKIWRNKAKIDAQLEQIRGELPYGVNVVDWYSYFKNRVQEARELTNTPDNIPDEVAIIGATGVTELMEQTAEMSVIAEQMTEDREIRERNLKLMGLDIDTLRARMSYRERSDFNTMLLFTKKRDEQEILMLAYSYVKSNDKEAFLNAMLTRDEKLMFDTYRDRILKNRDSLNRMVNEKMKNSKKNGMARYLEMLDAINDSNIF